MNIKKFLEPNPVTVKELRQVVRSRMVSTGLIGFLFIQVAGVALAVILGRSNSSDIYADALGKAVFGTVMTLLGIVVYISIPFFIAARMTAERKPERMDLQFTTSLTPTQFIDGKIMAAAALMALFASTSLPFLMLAYLLRGVDLFIMLKAFAFMGIGAVSIYYMALLFATINLSRVFRIIIAIATVQAMFAFVSATISMSMMAGSSLHMSMDWAEIAFMLFGVVTTCLLMRSIAAANISHPNANSARPFRRLVVAFWMAWLLVAAGNAMYYSEVDMMLPWIAISVVLSCVLMFLGVSSKPGCSRRVLMDTSPSLRKRLWQFLFFTGGENAIVFALTLGIATLAISYVPSAVAEPSGDFMENIMLATAMFMYPCAFLLTARLIWQLVLRRMMGPRYVGVVGLLLMFLGSLLPLLFFLPESLDMEGISMYVPGNIIAMLNGFDSSVNEEVFMYHCLVSLLWIAIMIVLFMPTLLKAFKAFRPPAKRQTMPDDMPAPTADTAS